jgi:esterase/lipase superfamily enzyme
MAKHFIVTNRQVRTNMKGDKRYWPVNENEFLRLDGEEEAMDNLRYGEVHFDPESKGGLSDFDIRLYPDLTDRELKLWGTAGDLPGNKKPGSRKVFDALHDMGMKTDHRADILVFVHGFNNDLKGAMQTLRTLHDRYVRPKECPIQHIVMFTWPARSNLTRYRDDARDAIKSGYAMARSFRALRDFFMELLRQGHRQGDTDVFCEQKIHLMCHSMGNRVLENMMAELNALNFQLNNTFGEILLLAADIDDDCLEPQRAMHKLIALGERVHIYYHNSDRALDISEKTKNAMNRLGRWGARRTMPLPDSVYQADVTHIDDERGLRDIAGHHWYYLHSPAVVRDVIDVLNGKTSVFLY